MSDQTYCVDCPKMTSGRCWRHASTSTVIHAAPVDGWQARAEKAEAQLTALQEALRVIRDSHDFSGNEQAGIAREALAALLPETPNE